METREVFFYGVAMDPAVLRTYGVEPGPARRAHVDGFILRIGRRATLVPRGNGVVHGMVFVLSPDHLRVVQALADSEGYQPEAVFAWVEGETPRPVLSFRRTHEPPALERDEDYARRLQAVLMRFGFPPDYVASIAGTADIG